MAAQAPRDDGFIFLPTPVLVGQPSGMLPGKLRMKTTVRNTVSTEANTFSQASGKVRNLVTTDFGMLYVGTRFLERLTAYVDTSYVVPDPAVPTPPYRATNAPPKEGVDIHPSTEQIVNGIIGMYLAEMAIRQGTPHPVGTNAGVQDVAAGQMFPVLNHALKTKEVNTIDKTHLPKGPDIIKAKDASSKRAGYAQWRSHFEFLDSNRAAKLRDVQKAYFCPLWTRPPPGLLQWPGTAGNADYVLLRSPSNASDTVVANCEIRQPWEYRTKDIWSIYESDPRYIEPNEPYGFNNDERFRSDSVSELLKMVFGQVEALQTSIGFFTNMDVIVFYCYHDGKRKMTDDDRNANDAAVSTMTTRSKAANDPELGVLRSGLVLSWPMSFTHPMALRCLQGLSYLALDAKRWKTRNLQVIDIVAPGDELCQIRPQLAIPQRGRGLVAPDPVPDAAVAGWNDQADSDDGASADEELGIRAIPLYAEVERQELEDQEGEEEEQAE